MVRHWLLAGPVLASLAGCAANEPAALYPANACPLVKLTEMSVAQRGDLLVTQAFIGGTSVNLVVDTGAERTLLTETAVQRLGLARDIQHATQTFGIGSASTSWDAKLPNGLSLGRRTFPIDTVSVGKFNVHRPGELPVDGLLGADLLLSYDVDLDLRHNRLTLYQPRTGCTDTAPPWNEPYTSIADVSTQGDRLMVPFTLDGVAGIGVLDTGAQLSSISRRMAARIGLTEPDMAADRTVMAYGAAPEQVAVRFHQFHAFVVGPTLEDQPMLPVVPMPEGMGDALIGADFLHGRRIWLSFGTRQVFVTPQPIGGTAVADLR